MSARFVLSPILFSMEPSPTVFFSQSMTGLACFLMFETK